MLALGAMQANILGALGCHNSLRFALEHYLQSITSLRGAVLDSTLTRKDSILWSTFFLGLFEVRKAQQTFPEALIYLASSFSFFIFQMAR